MHAFSLWLKSKILLKYNTNDFLPYHAVKGFVYSPVKQTQNVVQSIFKNRHTLNNLNVILEDSDMFTRSKTQIKVVVDRYTC